MKKVLLYSGGLDSELYRDLLNPDVLLFFHYNGKYSDKEYEQIKKTSYTEKVVVDTTFNFSSMERLDHIVPMRNVYMMLKAFEYGDTALIGVTYYDLHRDKHSDVLNVLQSFVRNYYADPTMDYPSIWDSAPRILAPYISSTKGELLKNVLENNGDILKYKNLRTCYSPTSDKGCGKCKSCLQKALALNHVGEFDPKLFDSDPRKATDELNDYIKYADKFRAEDFHKEFKLLQDGKKYTT